MLEGLEAVELKLSEVLEDNNEFRLNSEFFRKSYLNNRKQLLKLNNKYLHDGLYTFNTRYKQPIYDKNSNLKVINSQYIRDYYIDYESARRGYGETVPKEAVLINSTGVGTLGRVNINYLDSPFTLDNHVNVIVTKDINPYFLTMFLKSKHGQLQINRYYSGSSGQIEIYPKNFDNFIIPLFSNTFQFQIEKLVKTAYEKLKESKKLYKEAEELLLEELNLKDFKSSDENIAIKSFSKSFLVSGRLDSEYYQPKYDEIEEKIKDYKNGWDYLKNIVSWKKGVEVGSEAYQENGKDFIRISDFSINGIEPSSKKISDELYEELKKDFKPNIGDILFTKDGTIGISYVIKEEIEGILSGAFLKLTLKEEYKDYKKEALTLILNSIVTKLQVERLSGGAIIAHLKPSDFEKFIIPILEKNIQEQIEQKITLSFELKKESKELLDKAKKAVETAIEEGEDRGVEFIEGEKDES